MHQRVLDPSEPLIRVRRCPKPLWGSLGLVLFRGRRSLELLPPKEILQSNLPDRDPSLLFCQP